MKTQTSVRQIAKIEFRLCLSKIPKYLSGWRLYSLLNSIILADAHFSHDPPRNSVLDLPFACCSRTREALCHQIGVLQRFAAKRPKLTSGDRLSMATAARQSRQRRDRRTHDHMIETFAFESRKKRVSLILD